MQLRSLILIVTNECNKSCRYCLVKQKPVKMNFATAKKSLAVFFAEAASLSPLNIKFFGGEPFLNFDIVKKSIIFAEKQLQSNKLNFSITTNGTLIKNGDINFLKNRNNTDLWISYHNSKIFNFKNRLIKLPTAGINLTIVPENVNNIHSVFAGFLNLGFRKFNFLPGYFMKWPKDKLVLLKEELEIMLTIIASYKKRSDNIRVQNIYNTGKTPLFNSAIIVDSDGSIFLNNMFMAKKFAHLREDIKIGHVDNIDTINWSYKADYNKLLKDNCSIREYSSTLIADSILTGFVKKLRLCF